ncbi:hypothetical protein OBBRIDRAFT_837936 [Obba rivulosa]|uniref:Uncharacterized protein n=1 Tax=Obba rivulosa TaxID=1052685 RepID=A0A8E2ALJ3_9APHY|nr:hypothetical protein OBBRIDRAFT_837936 [Obba rivulosa]
MIVQSNLQDSFPTLPSLPIPGKDETLPELSKLVTLRLSGFTSRSNQLLIDANATLNPIPPEFSFAAPILPFTVSLVPMRNGADTLHPVVSVCTQPFTLTHPNKLPSPSTVRSYSSRKTYPVRSAFLRNYVSAIDSNIVLSSPMFPNLTIDATFPAPHPKSQILRNLTIKDMKIKPTGSTMTPSGTILAQIVLPKGIEVGLDVVRVFPDVHVYDGEVPGPDDPFSVSAKIVDVPL